MQDTSDENPNSAAIGILMLDTIFPRIPGDVGNPDTFDFPVMYKVVKGASPKKIAVDADPRFLQPFLDAAQELVKKGVKAISTSCGLLAMFHHEFVHALDVPIFTSSLLQVHIAQAIIRKDQKVGIIAARKQSVTAKQLTAVGIERYPLAIIGMEGAKEFSSVFIENKPTLDIDKCRLEVVTTALKLKELNPNIGAIVLECTNMPPYAKAIHSATGLPVFDIVTMINYAYSTLVHSAWKSKGQHYGSSD